MSNAPSQFAAPDGAIAAVEIRLSRVIAAPPALVFAAWTSSEAITQWFCPDAKVELRPGGPFEIYFAPESEPARGSEGCKILTWIPNEMLAFSWNAPPSLPDEREQHTWVVVRFEPAAGDNTPTDHTATDHTLVTLVHTGFPAHGFGPSAKGRWSEVVAYFEANWPRVLDSLQARFTASAP